MGRDRAADRDELCDARLPTAHGSSARQPDIARRRASGRRPCFQSSSTARRSRPAPGAMEDEPRRDGAAHRRRARCRVRTDTLHTCATSTTFPRIRSTNFWDDTVSRGFGRATRSTSSRPTPKVIERCMLMCTDPGDLVLDPTCGCGTTAFVAEQWGRRWITIDTSRVALALARQRLMGAQFPVVPARRLGGGAREGAVADRASRCRGSSSATTSGTASSTSASSTSR